VEVGVIFEHGRYTPEAYQQCADKGMTRAEAAMHLGVRKTAVKSASRRHGIKFKDYVYVSHTEQPVTHLGVDYPSQSALARAIKVSPQTITEHLNKGSIDRAGSKARDGKRKRASVT